MKHMRKSPFLLASLLVASVAFPQTRDKQAADSAPAENSISAARSRYIQTADVSPDADNTTLAQLYRGGPARPFPPQRGYSRESYQTPWRDHGNAVHIFIGAAIGFGVGAALGANKSAHNGTPVGGGIIIGGGLFGLLGGCVGKAVGDVRGVQYSSAHRRRADRPSGPEDEQSELRSHNEDHPAALAKPASPGLPAGIEAIAQASPMPAVP